MALQTQRPADVPGGHDATTRHLEEQAAVAALYVTKQGEGSQAKTGQEFLDSNHRLSSAGAATSLKYANPQDLPSFPSSGLKTSDSAAGAAASLGWAAQRPFTHWKPDPSTSASAAALRAKDYKMAPLWQPEQSAHGAKAAVLAHKGSLKVDVWQPEASPWGNSAALTAFKKFGAGGLSPVLDYGYNSLGRRGSLLAASGAMTNGRRRAESTPIAIASKIETYPDEKNATTNALRAAESASRRQMRAGTFEQGAIPYTAMPREMYTSHPPVAPEVEEMDRQHTLHASAVAMARNMYSQQQKKFEAVSDTPRKSHGRRFSASTSGDEVQPARFSNLQEAAHKLAQERLAKLHDKYTQNREYRDYYASPPPLSRFTSRGRTRRRAASDGGMSQDKLQSNKIRAQMSHFSTNVSEVDSKRQKDREALIAAAQRNVAKKLHGMDERVFADTGKVPPSLLSEWEMKAHAAAQEKSDTRMENYGKVHIGGGKFVNQSDIDQVAQKNVQPVLDEIQEKAEAEKARQAALKAEQETEARKAGEKKARDRESKDLNKKIKPRKSEEKNARKEEARLVKERRKSAKRESLGEELATAAPAVPDALAEPKEPVAVKPIDASEEPLTTTAMAIEAATRETVITDIIATEPTTTESDAIQPTLSEPAISRPIITEPSATTGVGTGLLTIGDKPPRAAPHPPVAQESESIPIRTSMEDEASLRMRENAARTTADEAPNRKVKSWFKNRFSRRLSRGAEKPVEKKPMEKEKERGKEEGFVGGAALAGASSNNSTASLERPSSSRDVALAGKVKEEIPIAEPGEIVAGPSDHCMVEEALARTAKKEAPSTDDEFQEARDRFDESLATPPTFSAVKEASPVRDSRFIEEI
ncbi:hypothetical protein OIDMADRAFT_102200 [Oidiodendron maius Zn]|uniref:Eisosome protein 1 n=1 Tax=Oidiodendron maius (strain Zn) TaxID=913774 RepID=A0A0C3DP29_OIDMZ|nr:hypothetical protein OIDMADRAFT_102200 [Oidiodendron maius Zn]